MTMKYIANFSVNNGTTLEKPLCGDNLQRIKKDIADSAKAEMFCTPGNVGRFWIENEHENTVISGNVFISEGLKPYIRYNRPSY